MLIVALSEKLNKFYYISTIKTVMGKTKLNQIFQHAVNALNYNYAEHNLLRA